MTVVLVLVKSHHSQRAVALQLAGLPVTEDEIVLEDHSKRVVGLLEAATLDDVAVTLGRWRALRPDLRVLVLADEEWKGCEALDATVMKPPVTAGDIMHTIDDLSADEDEPSPPSPVGDPPVPGVGLSPPTDGGAPTAVLARPLVSVVDTIQEAHESVPTPRRASAGRSRASSDIVEAVRDAIGAFVPLPAVADEICRRLAADPGGEVAVIEERGAGLHVLAGIGLRPLEWRDLDEPPEAVRRLGGRHRAMVVSDTDALRSEISLLPLGRHGSVVMARSPEPGHLLVVLGRDTAFSKGDVRSVLRELDERNDDVTAALRLREAAVLLLPFAAD